MENSHTSSPSTTETVINSEWFLNVRELTVPKTLDSLVGLWRDMQGKLVGPFIRSQLDELLEGSVVASQDAGKTEDFERSLDETDDLILHGMVRVLHVKNHLKGLDSETALVELPGNIRSRGIIKDSPLLESKLILQSFLDYLKANGTERFVSFLNETALRLISTVHPNETERNTNLRHYNAIQEKFIDWKKNYESLEGVPKSAPEYRIRRESLNQLRRAIKAEIEAVWQSDQLRRDPIPVESEALRIVERYKMIFHAFPMFIKFIKKIAQEAFWLYHGSIQYAKSAPFKAAFDELFKSAGSHYGTREAKLVAIKKSFAQIGAQMDPPRISNPIITFGTWKGGDRDGNPFVVAAFSNKCFVDHKHFTVNHYVNIAQSLVDKLTPSTKYVTVSSQMEKSIHQDFKIFPYLQNVKPFEPYRAKIRFVHEKLRNTLARAAEVLNQAGTTTKPLLSQTLPGPSGYTSVKELKADLNLVYESLVSAGGKSQARSIVQDLKILVETFGFHMAAIDFRQTSEKNFAAVLEYLKSIDLAQEADDLKNQSEKEKQHILLDLITRSGIELAPWMIPRMSPVSRDTFETLVVFADAANTDLNAIGKFIISMCEKPSDILVVLFLMKVVGMLVTQNNKITSCPFDVTGLFETVGDLKNAPQIISELLSIPLIRDYIIEHRQGKLTVMLGYSDSVRDGSALASDSQLIRSTLALKGVEKELNRKYNKPIKLVFYRGRGDTLARGFGGSITKSLSSQLATTAEEDHTEQNRYLRCYSSLSSTIDHLHRIYSAHVSAQLVPVPTKTERYQTYFDLFGRISNLKWLSLVSHINDGKGVLYFQILRKYSILPHLHKSHFASRPVARDGVTYNIDLIRAIPFTMVLAQMREFTSAFYGAGTGFELGNQYLSNRDTTIPQIVLAYLDNLQDTEEKKFRASVLDTNDTKPLPQLLRQTYGCKKQEDVDQLLKTVRQTAKDPFLWKVLSLYNSRQEAAETFAYLLLDAATSKQSTLEVLQEMYSSYAPFRYCIENKETSLIIRNKHLVDQYTKEATPEERELLDDTEAEAVLTKKWVLAINKQDHLESKTLTTDFNGPELQLLHKIQAKFLRKYRHTTDKEQLRQLDTKIQMSILAISEAIGFAG